MRGSRSLVSYLAGFALVLTLPILFAALAAAEWYAEQERTRFSAMADSASQGIAARLEHELSTHGATLQALVASNFLQMDDIGRFETQMREVSLRTNTHFALFDPTGRQLVNTRIGPGLPLPQAADGETVREVVRTKRLHVSNLARGTLSGEQQIHVAVPAMRGDDVVAILVSNLSSEHFAGILRDSLPRGPFYALLLDRAGVVVARTDGPRGNVGKPFSNFAEAGFSPKGRVAVPNLLGVPFFGSSRRQEISGWLVAAGVEQAALNAPFARFLQILALAVTGLGMLAFAGVRWVGKKLTLSHTSLVSAVQALGEGREIAPSAPGIHETRLICKIACNNDPLRG